MSNSETQEAVKPAGLFGRFFSKGKSPVRAKLGEENKFVFDEKLKRWVMPGEAVDDSAAAPAPPPVSRAASSSSMASDADKKSDSSALRGASARYAAVPFGAPKSGGPDSSNTPSAAFMPSPTKPPLGPQSKPTFILPGASSEGSAGASASKFFMPGAASATQSATPAFAAFRSQAKRSPGGGSRVQSDDSGPVSKRNKGTESAQEPGSAAVGSEVTLAHGIADAAVTSSEVLLAGGVPPAQGEESVGENTFASEDAADGITSPGLNPNVAGEKYLSAEPASMGTAPETSWASDNAGSVLDESPIPPAQGSDRQYQEDKAAHDPALEAAAGQGQAAEKSVEDWYREMQFYYNDSLQQYSATETEEWLRQHYGTLMDGFLIWLKANQEKQEGVPAGETEDVARMDAHVQQPEAVLMPGSESQDPGGPHHAPRSDVAEQGSIISDRDQAQTAASADGHRAESSASGKLTGPLPWDILDELSEDDDLSTTAGTPRFALTLTNGEPALIDNANPARPALAGAALAEVAEQTGGRIAGWVTNMVKSGALQQAVQQHFPMSMAGTVRFPRPPSDQKGAAMHSPTSVQSGGTSMLATAGTPSSIKSFPAESLFLEAQVLPQSATAGKISRSAAEATFPSLTEEQDSNPATDQYTMPGAEPQALQQGGPSGHHQEDFEEAHRSSSAQPQLQEAAEADADGWDFEDSALDGLGGSQPSQAHSDAASRKQYNDSHEQPSSAPVHAGPDLAVPSSAAVTMSGKAEDPHGNGSVAGMSPPGAGWEGESELNFPLDDIPKEPAPAISGAGGDLALPEGSKLKKLQVPPTSPFRAMASTHSMEQPDSSAALHEAVAHGTDAEKLAAYQRHMEELSAMLQQSNDDREALRDQNGAMEIELNDLKSRIDCDVIESRALEEQASAIPQLEEQLEDSMQEAQDWQNRYDALKADHDTLLAQRKVKAQGSPEQDAAPDANGDAGMPNSHQGQQTAQDPNGDGVHGTHHHREGPSSSLQHIAELEAKLEQLSVANAAAEERNAELEENVEQLMTDLDSSLQDMISRDEEIEKLEARLAEGQAQGAAGRIEDLEKEANAANQEVVLLSDELEKRDGLIEQLQQDVAAFSQRVKAQGSELKQRQELLAARDAELEQLHAKVESADSARIADLRAELCAAMSEVAAKALQAEGLKKELQEAQAAAAEVQADLSAQLHSQHMLTEDVKQQCVAARHELTPLQEAHAADQQSRSGVESQLKALQESAHLDLERINALSEENSVLKGRLAEAEASLATTTSEKDAYAKRGAKLQQRFNKLQADTAKKQEHAAAQLAELQQKLEDALATSSGTESIALQEALDKVDALEQRAAEAAAGQAEASKRAAEAESQVEELSMRAQQAEHTAAEAGRRAEDAKERVMEAAAAAEAHQAEVAAEAQRRIEESEAVAQNAVRELKEAASRFRAAEQQLAQESELRSSAERHAAELEASLQALEAEKAAHEAKVSQLEEEASEVFERCSGLEDELGAVRAQAHSHAQALAAAQAELEAVKAELTQMPSAEPEKAGEDDMENLMSALGQESEKVDKLVELLQERGFDPTDLLTEIEERYADGMDDEAEDVPGVTPEVDSHTASCEPVQLHDNAAFDGMRGHNASLFDEEQHADGSAAAAAAAQSPAQQGNIEGFGDKEPLQEVGGSGQPYAQHPQASSKESALEGRGHENALIGDGSAIEGLPEGELLSPPQLPSGKADDLAAKIDFGEADAGVETGDGWDNWDL